MNPAQEGQTFTLKQMEAFAELTKLGFMVTLPKGENKDEEPKKVRDEKPKATLASPYFVPTPSFTDAVGLETAKAGAVPNLKNNLIRKWGMAMQA